MSIEKAIIAISAELKLKFVKDGQEYSAEQVLVSGGYLSPIVKKADRLCEFCLGQKIGAIYDNSMQGQGVSFDDKSSKLIILLFITDILIELSSGSKQIDLGAIG